MTTAAIVSSFWIVEPRTCDDDCFLFLEARTAGLGTVVVPGAPAPAGHAHSTAGSLVHQACQRGAGVRVGLPRVCQNGISCVKTTGYSCRCRAVRPSFPGRACHCEPRRTFIGRPLSIPVHIRTNRHRPPPRNGSWMPSAEGDRGLTYAPEAPTDRPSGHRGRRTPTGPSCCRRTHHHHHHRRRASRSWTRRIRFVETRVSV